MQEAAALFKALSEEVRLRILALLAGGELCVCDLIAVLALPQSTISRHLASLRHAGLVAGRRQGVWMYYRLAEGRSEQDLVSSLRSYLAELPAARDDREALAFYLKNKDREQAGCG